MAGEREGAKGPSDLATEILAREEVTSRGLRLVAHWNGGSVAVDLPASGTITMGRGEGADVLLDATSVSRRHATLHLGDPLFVEDLGSSNGTFVDGQRLAPQTKVVVRVGNLIEVGTVLVGLHGNAKAAAPPVEVDDVTVAAPAMVRAIQLADLVARGKLSVLIQGETGVGKELVAARIHAQSPRRAGPFRVLRCASVEEAQVDAELFGLDKDGPSAGQAGLLEQANGGTLVLDDLGDLPLGTQGKLLRVIEAGAVTRVGGHVARPVDVRLVACTSRGLESLVAAGRFRQDLYFRLDGFSLRVPALRDRLEDIPALARAFAREAARDEGRQEPTLEADAVARLVAHAWPGNVRELKTVIVRTVLFEPSASIRAEHLAWTSAERGRDSAESRERQRVAEALEKSAGNQTRAAKLLGISRRTLLNRLDAFGLPRPRKKADEDE
ncbi:MAG: sigma 54-interacting transcriptional regulator [Myxococcales bacterium]|nr:sigma 54-interacting transcriptional regulator [Myxococcales bacterium]